jgi:hypothetical protein
MPMPTDSLSILDIQEGLIECLAAREEAYTPEEVAAADAAISAYLDAEITKADGIARAVRQWTAMAAADKAEASRLRDRSAALEGRVARLREFVRFAMEKSGRRRIEGKLSTIRIQGAGGKQGVDVQNEALLPDELCMAEITMSYEMWCRVEKEFFGGASSKWGAFIKRGGTEPAVPGVPRSFQFSQ